MTTIYYDLTELYFLARARLKFFGIARVVAEVGYEMHLLNKGVVFVVYDETHRAFFEIKPNFGKASYNGLVDLDLPKSALPFRLRGKKRSRGMLHNLYADGISSLLKGLNRFKYRVLGRYVKPISLGDGVLLSAGQPRIIADYIDYLIENGSKTQLFALLHDCIPLHDFYPKPTGPQLNFHADNDKTIRYASHIIANSDFTAADLLAKSREGLLPSLPAISTVPLAHECREDGGVAEITVPDRPYVLGVGIAFGRKNLDIVLDAQLLMLRKGKTPPVMVIAGANKPRTLAKLKVGRYAELAQYIVMANSPAQADLISLYRNAMATVMPSKLEGWGLPLGESLWLGTPALAATSSSLPEVGLDLALYFDPNSPEELASLFERLLEDDEYRDALKRRVAEARPRLRSWKNVAEDMLAVVPEVEVVRPSAEKVGP